MKIVVTPSVKVACRSHEKNNAEGYKSIAYTQVIPVLIEAVKSQQVIVEKQQKGLKAQRQSLQSQIDELHFRLAELVGERM